MRLAVGQAARQAPRDYLGMIGSNVCHELGPGAALLSPCMPEERAKCALPDAVRPSQDNRTCMTSMGM